MQVVRLKLEDRTDAEVAAEVGISDRQVRKVWAAWRDTEKQSMTLEDPLDVVWEHVAGFRELRRKMHQVFHESAGTAVETDGGSVVYVGGNLNVRLGALKGLLDLRVKEIQLRQETGLLPRDLGQLSVALDVRYWTEQVLSVLQRAEVREELIDELLGLLKEAGQLPPDDALELPPGEAYELEDEDDED